MPHTEDDGRWLALRGAIAHKLTLLQGKGMTSTATGVLDLANRSIHFFDVQE